MKLITTSWDDGHPLDFKLADLLIKYNLPATFYIPKTNAERQVMGENQIRELSQAFDIGGHTLHHTRLTAVSETAAQKEVSGCFTWLSNLLGKAPESFCFPGGVYNDRILQTVFTSGFRQARTTALFTTSMPMVNQASDTTLQAYPHSALTYTKHLIKRQRWKTLFHWMKSGSQTSLYKLSEQFIDELLLKDECFHLWGHSWEIEAHNLWQAVEEIFKLIANRPDCSYVQNSSLAASPQQPVSLSF